MELWAGMLHITTVNMYVCMYIYPPYFLQWLTYKTRKGVGCKKWICAEEILLPTYRTGEIAAGLSYNRSVFTTDRSKNDSK